MSLLPETPPALSPWEAQSLGDAMRRQLEIYTPQSLASKLQVSKRAILKAIKSGELQAHRVNSKTIQIESVAAARWWVSLSH